MKITEKMLDAMANAVREGRNDDVIAEKAGLTPQQRRKAPEKNRILDRWRKVKQNAWSGTLAGAFRA